MIRQRRHRATLALAAAAVAGTIAMTPPADAGHRIRSSCNRSYVRYDSSRNRALNRARWQAGQYGRHYVHHGRIDTAGFGGTCAYQYDDGRRSRRHHVRADRQRGRRHRQR